MRSSPPILSHGKPPPMADQAEGRLAALESQALDPATQGAAAEVMRSAGYPMPPLWERVRALERRLQEREPTSCDPHISKEYDMPQVKLGWFDRLLLKIAIAKAAARGEVDLEHAQRAFSSLNVKD